MKRCPECKRDYFDDSLRYCLDDGNELLEGPGTPTLPDPAEQTHVIPRSGEEPTRILPNPAGQSGTEGKLISPFQKRLIAIFFVSVLLAAGIYYFYSSSNRPGVVPDQAPAVEIAKKFYWDMTEPEQIAFVRDRSAHVQSLIGDDASTFDEEAIQVIRLEIADYVDDRDSLSQKPFEEGLRVIYGRATQFVPTIARQYEAHRLPAALGIYQAMIESEYHDCPESHHPKGPVGLFQFSRKTAEKYGLQPNDYCNVEKQADAAARHMSDLMSDFGTGGSNASLGLFSFASGADRVREYLRKLRSSGVTERSYWAILRHRRNVVPDQDLISPNLPLVHRSINYVPRFFAAAIIGETPAAFDLPTPPLSSLASRNGPGH